METRSLSKGILDGERSGTREDIVALLTKAYWMEMETAMSYLAASRIDILRDEQAHRRLFEGFLREYELEGKA